MKCKCYCYYNEVKYKTWPARWWCWATHWSEDTNLSHLHKPIQCPLRLYLIIPLRIGREPFTIVHTSASRANLKPTKQLAKDRWLLAEKICTGFRLSLGRRRDRHVPDDGHASLVSSADFQRYHGRDGSIKCSLADLECPKDRTNLITLSAL